LAQKELEKKTPSTMAKVMRHSANKACCELHHISAHFAFAPMVGIVSIACIVYFILFLFVLDIHVNGEGIGFIVDVFHHELKAIEILCFK
jgi:hypothetical protein